MNPCQEIALRLLARREHSRVELDRKLFVKGCGKSEIQGILDQLESEGLLSDARFTEAYVRTRRQRGFGPLRIAMELAQRGITQAMINEHLHARSEDWFELASSELVKRYGKRRARSYKERARQARFLQGRGFDFEIISRALDEVD